MPIKQHMTICNDSSDVRQILKGLQRQILEHYYLYQSGKVSEREYLRSIKPLDRKIDKMEMSIFQDSFVRKAVSSKHAHVQKNVEA